MSNLSYYLPGLICGISWDPKERVIAFDYNENLRITRKMPESFSSDDFARVMEINHKWRGWKSHYSGLSFNPVDFGIASAETPVEAVYLYINSFA